MDIDDMIDKVRDYLDTEEYKYEFDSENNLIRTGFGLGCKLKNVKVIIEFKKHGFMVLAYCPLNGDEENLDELLRFITMANYGLINGNFEVDVRDGEIRYKTWVPTENMEDVSPVIIEDSIMIPCSMMDKYGNGLAALAMGFSDAQTEFEKVIEQEKAVKDADEDAEE